MHSHLRWALLSISLFIELAGIAQSISGRIYDSKTGKGIPFSNVYIRELQTGTRADSSGYFVLEGLPAKEVHLEVSAIGYTTGLIPAMTSSGEKMNIGLDPSHVELTEVVVSMPTGKLESDNILMVEKKKLTALERSSSNSLMESVANLAGVDQVSTGTGIGKPVIRGLTGNRVVTYAQGIRVENQQWGSEHGLGVGDVGINGVEVIKGPNSLLYGSDAIGGVLYFTDEDYAAVDRVEGFGDVKYYGNSLAGIGQAGIKVHRKKYKQNFFASFRNNADYQVPGGKRVVNSRFDQSSFKTSLGYNNDFWVTNLRYSYLENNFGITEVDSLYNNSESRQHLPPFQNIADHKISSENIFFIGKTKFEAIFGYTSNRRKEFETSLDSTSLDMTLRTMSYNLRLRLPEGINHIIIGLQGMYQTNQNAGIEALIPDAKTNDAGLYAMTTFPIAKIEFQGGLRLDFRKLDGLDTYFGSGEHFTSLSRSYTNLNASAGIRYPMSENIVLRLNLSTGFRAPNSSELLSNGAHEGSNRYEVGDPDLKTENASQTDFSLSFTNEHIDITFNPFINFVRNYIYLRPEDSIVEGKPLYFYDQINAVLMGAEYSLHYHPHSLHWLHFETAFSAVYGFDKDENALPLMPANNVNSTLKVEFGKAKKLRISEAFLQHIYKLGQYRTAAYEVHSDPYQLFNAGLIVGYYVRRQNIELKIGLNNALDQRYIDHLSRLKTFGVPGQGRNLYAGLRYEF